MSFTKGGRGYSGEPEVVVRAGDLLNAIKQSQGKKRLDKLKELCKLCKNPEHAEILCLNQQLSLLTALKEMLEDISYSSDICSIVDCFSDLSVGEASCQAALTSKELGLLPVLMTLLRSSLDEELIESAETTFLNCSEFEGCHDYLLSSSVRWLDYIEKRLYEQPHDDTSYWCFSNFIKNMRDESVKVVLDRKIAEVVLLKIVSFKTSVVNSHLSAESVDVFREAVEFVMWLSKSSVGSYYLKEYFAQHFTYFTFFFDLLKSSSTAPGIYSTIILANVYGREENNERTKALLDSNDDILPVLIDIMDALMDWNYYSNVAKELWKKGFRYGTMELSLIAVALRRLSVSDENKKTMIRIPKLINVACKCLALFIRDAPQCKGMNFDEDFYNPGGGGGNDFVTLENLLELLLQLVFALEEEGHLHAAMTASDGTCELQCRVREILNLPSERCLSAEVKRLGLQLLSKLSPPVDDEKGSKAFLGESTAQHIMLSYSWSAGKQLVIEFGKKLKDLGFDVWRDEEGSDVMGPVSAVGNILDSMTEAVEKSAVMIIFVSPEYKESGNCRFEAHYGFTRAGNSGLKLIYVMMNEHYHTRSFPVRVDGWLGGMVGAEVWYPLWDVYQLDSTVNEVAVKIRGCFLKDSKGEKPSASPVSALTKSEMVRRIYQFKVDDDADYVSAFECLKHTKSICPDIFEANLRYYGISEVDDLKDANMKKIIGIHSLLKDKTGEMFMKSLKL
jgi:hypothetical protein